MHSWLSILLAVALGACSPAPSPPDRPATSADSGPADSEAVTVSDSVRLEVDRVTAHAGDTLGMTLVNRSAQTYAFNPCTRTLEAAGPDGWAAVAEPQRVCTMEAWLLEPHAERAARTELPAPLPPGRYRFTLMLTQEGQTPPTGRLLVASTPFTVAP